MADGNRRDAELGGVERALILLLAMEEEVASRVVAELSDTEIQLLHGATRSVQTVDAKTLNNVYDEFVVAMKATRGLAGGDEYLRKLAGRALGHHRAQKLLKDQGDSTDALQRLHRFDPRTLSAVLERENPQAVAAILAHLEPAFAADILLQFEGERQYDVFRRLTRLGEVPESTLREVTDSLAGELAALGDAHSTSVDGPARAAAILQNSSSEASNAILNQLEVDDPAVAGEIRRSMFTFEDLVRLDNRSMQALIREISTEQLVVALKTASEDVRNKFFGNVSSRAAEMIRDDLEALGPMRVSDVERAQQDIVEVAQRLESEGKIVIMGGGEDFV
jgi:flagellar motor switch protein FliG